MKQLALIVIGVAAGALIPPGAATIVTLQVIAAAGLLLMLVWLLNEMNDRDRARRVSDYTPMTLADAETRARLDEAAGDMGRAIDELEALITTGPGGDYVRLRCRKCGCTDDDCSGCIERTGEPCYWVERDLCCVCAVMSGAVDGFSAAGRQAIMNAARAQDEAFLRVVAPALITTGVGGDYRKRHESDSIVGLLGGDEADANGRRGAEVDAC